MDSRTRTVPIIDVAAGIVMAPDGRVLLGQRPAGKPYAGWWEFPGGKVESGESVGDAIARELCEELGLRVTGSCPWLVREHVYEHAHVRLHFRRVDDWSGQPESREGQAFRWCDPRAVDVHPLLPATVPLMRLLALPPVYAISAAGEVGTGRFLARLDEALAAGLRLLQLREPTLDEVALDALLEAVLRRCRAHGARLLVNSRHGSARAARADGMHLTGTDLARLGADPSARPVRGGVGTGWLAASCHDARELGLAAHLGVDFAVMGPVLPTRSHPGASSLGWSGFAAALRATALPVYALGGMQPGDLQRAQKAGAHGIAMIGSLFR